MRIVRAAALSPTGARQCDTISVLSGASGRQVRTCAERMSITCRFGKMVRLRWRSIHAERTAIELRALDRPVDGMAVVEAEAALAFLLAFGLRGEAGLGTCARVALLEDVDIGGVRGGEVVVVEAVLELQLPIAVERVGARARHELDLAGLALVDDEIKEGAGVAEEIFERRYVGRQACEQEAAIGSELCHRQQVMVGVGEGRRILPARFLR